MNDFAKCPVSLFAAGPMPAATALCLCRPACANSAHRASERRGDADDPHHTRRRFCACGATRRRTSACGRAQGARADRQAARRDQLRQQRAGAEGPRRRAARRLRRSVPRAGEAPRRAARIRDLHGGRKGVRSGEREQDRRAVRRDRAGARRRDRIHAALRADRRRVSGPEGLAGARAVPTSISPASASRSARIRPTTFTSRAR